MYMIIAGSRDAGFIPDAGALISTWIFRFRRKLLDSTDVRWTGALEPPDFNVSEMQRVRARHHHGFLTTPLGVFGRGLDSALMRVWPRAPEISFFA